MTQHASGQPSGAAPSPFETVRARYLEAEPSLSAESLFKLIRPLALALFAVGFLARLTPLLDIKNRLFWQFMSEDGYLMQTIARNMAIGLGMSTADGTVATNGVQPLATFIFAGLHWLVGGDRVSAIALVTIVSAVIATGAAYFLYRLGRMLLQDIKFGDSFALAIAAIWFVGPLTTAHSMNGLETGLYMLTMLASLCFFVSRFSQDSEHVRGSSVVILGALLGFTFLARNDAVFFIAALLLTHLLVGRYDVPSLTRRLAECAGAGSLSVAIALPWLIHNYRLFGTIVPISGISQSHNATLGTNLRRLPAVLFETAVPVLPIPGRLEELAIVAAVATAFLATVLIAYWLLCGRHHRQNKMFIGVTMMFGAALATYYGIFFGAPHFLARYMSILSPLLWSATATVAIIVVAAALQRARWVNLVVVAALSVILAGASVWSLQSFRHGDQHMHKQVVDWVSANVPKEQWAGAVQTGTLGYFHDRTLNLDGKVNPAALRELLLHGHVLDYVIGTRVAFIVDWAGVSDWAQAPEAGNFNRYFELAVKDDAKNLSVFRRRAIQPSQ